MSVIFGAGAAVAVDAGGVASLAGSIFVCCIGAGFAKGGDTIFCGGCTSLFCGIASLSLCGGVFADGGTGIGAAAGNTTGVAGGDTIAAAMGVADNVVGVATVCT